MLHRCEEKEKDKEKEKKGKEGGATSFCWAHIERRCRIFLLLLQLYVSDCFFGLMTTTQSADTFAE